jgi:hypothetical protein
MGPRVLPFVLSSGLPHRRPTQESTRVSMNTLLNDLQVLAIDMPTAFTWIADIAHRLALIRRKRLHRGQSSGTRIR